MKIEIGISSQELALHLRVEVRTIVSIEEGFPATAQSMDMKLFNRWESLCNKSIVTVLEEVMTRLTKQNIKI
jgi:DNA-binding XRE family transcriptional regulator